MAVRMSKEQFDRFSEETAKAQLDKAAQDLFQRVQGDFTYEAVRARLELVALDAQGQRIERVKYLKILTLWSLYPDAAPDVYDLQKVLKGPGDQDSRMRAAIALPVGASPDRVAS